MILNFQEKYGTVFHGQSDKMAQYGAVPAEAFIIMTQKMFAPILRIMIHNFYWFHPFSRIR